MHYPRWTIAVLPSLGTIVLIVGFLVLKKPAQRPVHSHVISPTSIFSPEFPVHEDYQRELAQLRFNQKLAPENEQAILHSVTRAADTLGIPTSLLWCLLFQESRLNHLVGKGDRTGSVGLGQFSKFSFWEINHQLTKFTETNLRLFESELGIDPRPVHSRSINATLRTPAQLPVADSSSYFHIPTAVFSSAAYLNNRKHHLEKLLVKQGYFYDPDLIWIYAALAYNKGTRSILALWNTTRSEMGDAKMKTVLQDYHQLTDLVGNSRLVLKSFQRIWPKSQSQAYAKEWIIHFRNTSVCAMKTEKVVRLPEKAQGG